MCNKFQGAKSWLVELLGVLFQVVSITLESNEITNHKK